MNEIQRKILSKLYVSKSLKFSEAKPEGIESDLYNYHLKYLLSNQLIRKEDGVYMLSFYGKKYIADLNPMDIKGQNQDVYKVNVLTGAIRRNKSGLLEALVEKRKRQPFFNKTSIMGGNLKKGEPVEKAAKRIFKEHTSITSSFKHIGIIRKIILDKDKEIFTDIIFLLCFTENPIGMLLKTSEYGENEWVDINKAIEQESKTEYVKKLYIKLKSQPLADIPLFYTEEKQTVKDV